MCIFYNAVPYLLRLVTCMRLLYLKLPTKLVSVVFLGIVSDSCLFAKPKDMFDSVAQARLMECALLVYNPSTVPSESTLIFGPDANECNGPQGSLFLFPILVSNMDSKGLKVGSDIQDATSLAPSLAVAMGCDVPNLCMLGHPASPSLSSQTKSIASWGCRLLTFVGVTDHLLAFRSYGTNMRVLYDI